LLRFVDARSQPIFRAFLERTFAGEGKQVCEANVLKGDGGSFWANLYSTSANAVRGPRKSCRVAISDITLLKQAEESRRRLEALAMANEDLKGEILRRQAVEEALKKSEHQQTLLLQQSRRMQEQLRHLSHRILQAQEEERKRISRELHDEIAQTLVGINVQLETLARQINPRDFKQEIARTQRLVERSVNMVHKFARELRPTLLDDLGLIATLHSFVKDFTKRTGIRVRFTTFAGVEQLNNTRRTVLYRVAQSALTNVAQHARASRVKVDIRQLPEAVCMEIADNGKAFEVERVLHSRRNKRLGLVGMRERVEMIGGAFSVESTPSQGTTIRALIPLGNGESPKASSDA
jgi:signal transduction histidine kinase